MNGDVNDTIRPEEKADVSSELAVRPVGAVVPRELNLLDRFINEFHGL